MKDIGERYCVSWFAKKTYQWVAAANSSTATTTIHTTALTEMTIRILWADQCISMWSIFSVEA